MMQKTFKIDSGAMVVSDPCYTIDPPTWCQGIIPNVKPGLWTAGVDMNDNGRIKSIYAYNNEAYLKNSNIIDLAYKGGELPFVVGVDSGQAGFFDQKYYRDDEIAKDLPKEFEDNYAKKPGDEWYRACAAQTLGEDRWGTVPYGVVSSSGWGDGSYICTGEKDSAEQEYIALVIIFIEYDGDFDDDNWDDDSSEEEEDNDNI